MAKNVNRMVSIIISLVLLSSLNMFTIDSQEHEQTRSLIPPTIAESGLPNPNDPNGYNEKEKIPIEESTNIESEIVVNSYINVQVDETLESTDRTVTINFVEGWNLISLPIVLFSMAPNDLFPNDVEIVWQYNYEQEWQVWNPDSPDYANTLKEVDPYLGLWIKASKTFTETYSGLYTEDVNILLPSTSGWYLISYPFEQTMSVAEVKPYLLPFDELKGYDESWYVYKEDGSNNNLSSLEPNKAYWIKLLPTPKRNLKINEVMVNTNSTKWIELVNLGSTSTYSNLRITNETTTIGTISSITIPASSYLTIYLSSGVNDLDFTDNKGSYFIDNSDNSFTGTVGGLSIYTGELKANTIVDCVYWGNTSTFFEGDILDHARASRIWPDGMSCVGGNNWINSDSIQHKLPFLEENQTIARDSNSVDSDSPSDWFFNCGIDSDIPTPGLANAHTVEFEMINPVAIFDMNTSQQYDSSEGAWGIFNASHSVDRDGEIVFWNWNFSDGETDFGKVVNHTFIPEQDEYGLLNYTVTLTVTDDEGLTNSSSHLFSIWCNQTNPIPNYKLNVGIENPDDLSFKVINVLDRLVNWASEGNNYLPDVSIEGYSPSTPRVFDIITLDVDADDPDNVVGHGIERMSVDWGDGTKTTKSVGLLIPDFTHRYMDAKTYPIKVTAIDDDSQSYSIRSSITIQPQLSKRFTFAIYVNGDDNVLDSCAFTDVNEMEEVGSNSNLNILVEYDRLGQANIHQRTKRSFIVQDSDSSSIISPYVSMGEKDLGDPNELVDFFKWVKRTSPSTYTVVVIWNHGMGWEGASWDKTNANNFMDIKELKTALTTIKSDNGDKLDLLCYDACLMGQVEVAYQMRDFADYMVASAETVPGNGFPYDKVLSHIDGSITPIELGNKIVDEYKSFYQGSGAKENCLANYDLSKVFTLKTTIDSLIEDLENSLEDIQEHYVSHHENIADLLRWARKETLTYCVSRAEYRRELTDLYHLIEKLKEKDFPDKYSTSFNAVQRAVEQNIVSYWVDDNVDDGKAYSIYFPRTRYRYNHPSQGNKYDSFGNDFLFLKDSKWDELLMEIYKPIPDAGEDKCVYINVRDEYNARGSSDIDSKFSRRVEEYNWDWGDGTTATYEKWVDSDHDYIVDTGELQGNNLAHDTKFDGIANHVYTSEGEYTVTLTVKDWYGETATDNINVYVKNAHPHLPAGEKPNATWTIMLYAAAEGDNPILGISDLDSYIFEDLNELEKVNTTTSKIEIVAQVDYASRDSGKTMRYDINYDATDSDSELGANTTSWEIAEANTGSSTDLVNFVKWAIKNKTSCNYILILWDRSMDYYGGDGWKGNPDDGERPAGLLRNTYPSNDVLLMQELKDATNSIHSELNRSIEIIGFDSSLMGMIEVADMIKEDAKVMIASEAAVNTDGWEYNEWLEVLNQTPSMQYEDLSKVIVNHASKTSSIDTLSALALENITGLANELSAFANQLRLGIDDYQEHVNIFDNVQILVKDVRLDIATTYGSSSVPYPHQWDHDKTDANDIAWINSPRFTPSDQVVGDMDYIDLLSFVRGVWESEVPYQYKSHAPSVINNITESVVIDYYDNYPGGESHGISIYFPYQAIRWFGAKPEAANQDDYLYEFNYYDPTHQSSNHYTSALDFSRTQWDEFLERYYEPVADIGFDIKESFVGEPVSFPGMGSSDSDFKGILVSQLVAIYDWDFGDGSIYIETWDDRSSGQPQYNNGVPDTSEISNPPDPMFDGFTTHIYSSAGTYHPRLLVVDDDGFTHIDHAVVIVYDKPSTPLYPRGPIYPNPPPYNYTYPPGPYGPYYPYENYSTPYYPKYINTTTEFRYVNPYDWPFNLTFYRIRSPTSETEWYPTSGTGYGGGDYLLYNKSFTLMDYGLLMQDAYFDPLTGQEKLIWAPLPGEYPYRIEYYFETDGPMELYTEDYFLDNYEPSFDLEPIEGDGDWFIDPETGITSYYLISNSPAYVNISISDGFGSNPYRLYSNIPEIVRGSGIQEAMYMIEGITDWIDIPSGGIAESLDPGKYKLLIYAKDNLNNTINTSIMIHVKDGSFSPSEVSIFQQNMTYFSEIVSIDINGTFGIEFGTYEEAWYYSTIFYIFNNSETDPLYQWIQSGVDFNPYDSAMLFSSNMNITQLGLSYTDGETITIMVEVYDVKNNLVVTLYGEFVYYEGGS